MSEPLRIVGVDVGNTTCWCILKIGEPDRPAFARLVRPRRQPMRDWLHAVAAMTRTVCKGDGVMWIEQPMGSFRRTIFQQGMMIGAIQIGLPPRWTCDLIGPTEWRAAIGLPGNASKAVVQEWAARAAEGFPEPLDEHHADSFAVAYAAYTSGGDHGKAEAGRAV